MREQWKYEKPTVYLHFSLDVTCPGCLTKFDVAGTDCDLSRDVVNDIFNNRWNKAKDKTLYCPHCHAEFDIAGIEY